MVNKKDITNFIVFLLFGIFIVVSLSNFVSSQTLFCAQRTVDGVSCMMVPENEIDKEFGWSPTSCQESGFCEIGTCRNENVGTCTQNTPKSICVDDGGIWSPGDKEDIRECRAGCCVLGEGVAFVNGDMCRNLATQYGVDFNFRSDITTQSECRALDTTETEGACVVETTGGTTCERTNVARCINLRGDFREGLLCTASVEGIPISDCARDSTRTRVHKDRVHFIDTCNNLANVYDVEKFNDREDYWTFIQEPSCIVGGNPSSTCGDCSYRQGTIGAPYSRGMEGMPNQAPQYGNNVCKESACYYDSTGDGRPEKFSHGESWCAGTPGTFPGIPVRLDDETKRELAEGYNKYNLPGSQYTRLSCYDGEVIPEPCGDFARNSICMEGNNPLTEKREAACFVNPVADCFENANRGSCDENIFCKWVPGYAQAGLFIGQGLGEVEAQIGKIYENNLERYNDLQGTCYPLISPGTDFWTAEGDAHCSEMGNVVEEVLFETHLLTSRNDFAERGVRSASERCIDNCWAIPGYGSTDGINYPSGIVEILKRYHLERESKPSVIMSDREGYYCLDSSGVPDVFNNWETGGGGLDCGEGRRRVKQFYTHEQWLRGISEGARSVGDCGYKPHAYSDATGWRGDSNSERIVVNFEKLTKSLNVDRLVGDRKLIYRGSDIDAAIPISNSGYRNV